MAELVYAFDLKSNGETRAGSIPAPSTNITNLTACQVYFLFTKRISPKRLIVNCIFR